MTGEILPAVGDFPAGSLIASYRIEQVLGRGGMAVVYRASDVRLDRQVALKILTPELARNDAFRQRFILESRAAAAVDHPNVIPVFEAGEAEGVLFIAMRYVAGQDVRALIDREGKLPVARVVNIVTQVASALDAAHAHGLVHRDVKPANMLLAAVGEGHGPDHVYLSDFGLSKHSLATSSLTGTGQFLGTLDYMAPEQVEGRAVDGRTDLYALGCAAFEMLAGEPPFRRDQTLAVMWAQISAPPPSVRRWRPELSPEVDRVMARALAKSPPQRQSSCQEFARELRAACAVAPAEPAEPAGPAVTARPPAGLAVGPGVPAPAVPAVTPPVHGAALIGQQDTITENAPGGMRGGASGFAPTDPGAARPGARVGSGGPARPGAGVGYGGAGRPGAGARSGAPAAGAPGGPGPTTPPYYQGEPGYQRPVGVPKRRRGALPLLFGVMVIIGLVAAVLIVLYLRGHHAAAPGPGQTTTITVPPRTGSPSSSASTTPSQSTTPSTPPGPAHVVAEFYHAINAHQYRRAYALNHSSAVRGTPFATWKQGYVTTTRHVYLTVLSVSGEVVTIDLAAVQTNGTTKHYQGTYTVRNGVIVSSDVHLLSG